MIHKYYYLFTRPSVIVVCWKSIFFKSLQFFQGRIIWITFGWGALGAETLCLSGVKICPCNTLGGNLGRQVENVCPLGAEKGQNLPSSALRRQAIQPSIESVWELFLFGIRVFTLIHYFYNSKNRCNHQKQIAFLKSRLKSMLIKKKIKKIQVITETIP